MAHDLVLEVQVRPGDFVLAGVPLLLAGAADRLPDATTDTLRSAFAIGDRRTDLQDLRFGFDELTEIAIRALSPGINDPFTAIACLDWLTAALSECEKVLVPDRRHPSAGIRRVSTIRLGFRDFVDTTFGRMRQHLATEAQVRDAACAALSRLAADATSPENRALLLIEHAALEATPA